MSAESKVRSRRGLWASIAIAVVVVVAVVIFHRPLIAWFGGTSVGGHEGVPTTVQTGPFVMKAALDPDPPREKGNALVLDVADANGNPVEDATVEVTFEMPAMGAMSEMKGGASVSHEKGGRYRAQFDLPMAGSWTLKTAIRSPRGEASRQFTLTVGSAGLGIRDGTGPSAANAGEIDHYTCSMHPSVNQKAPGKCPICGMDLVPVTKEQQAQGVVTIDEARRQLIGVRTAPIIIAPMTSAIRAVGQLSYDESSLTDVNLKVRGWITKLYVNQTGQRVTRGQTLFDLYSPELYNAQQDYLLALGATGGAARDASSRVEGLAPATRQRLRLLGLEDAQIEAIGKRGSPLASIAFSAPASGFVIEKNVVEGASVDPGTRLYRIAALGKVWVEADVYEADLANVRVGQRAGVTLDYLPGRTYDAKVSYVYPYLDPKARTGRVRVELANKDLDLRPGMYATVMLSADASSRMQVPTSAVVYTGPRRLVFVDLGQGRFRPQEIQVGAEANGYYEVLAGLSAGDVVATSGVFLIAAEARISTASKYWESAADDAGAATPGGAMMTMPPASSVLITPSAPSSALLPRSTTPDATSPQGSSPSRTHAPTAPSSVPGTTTYTCPMHPEVQSATPGRCPKCGMDLVPMRDKP